MGPANSVCIASCGDQFLQIPAPAIQRTTGLGHFIAPLKQFGNLLSRQPFAALNPIEVMQQHLKYFYLRMELQKLF
jgi:hypothetical protein